MLLATGITGINLLARDFAQAAYFPAGTAPVATVAVYWHYVGDDISSSKLLGIYEFVPKLEIAVSHYLVADRDVVVYGVSYTAAGVAGPNLLSEAVQATALANRETLASVIGQVGAATTEQLTIGVANYSNFARRRLIEVADNSAMTNASRQVVYIGDREVAKYIDISRQAMFQPGLSLTGNDPGSNGFTKTGSGTTASRLSRWRINTLGSDGQTCYSKNSWPSNPFTNGFTLELEPPTIDGSDGAALPNSSVAVQVENGSKRYELTFSGTNVMFNGGTSRAHGGSKIRLVIASGGNAADLWIGDSKVETATAGVTTTTSGLKFGDLTDADDANVIWKNLAYALNVQPVILAETIYVRVRHTAHEFGERWGPTSNILAVSFASTGGAGGSAGTYDPVPRDNYEYV